MTQQDPIAEIVETARTLDADTWDRLQHYATQYLADGNRLPGQWRRSHAHTNLLHLLGALDVGPTAQHWAAAVAAYGVDGAMTALAAAVRAGEAGAA
ncbi:hypothetical protein ACXZ65_34310 [Streptomyces aculeolatus]